MHRIDAASPTFEAEFAALLADQRELSQDVSATTQAIIDDVRARGDAALHDYTLKFDRLDLSQTPMRISAEELEAAAATVPAEAIAALEFARERIAAFHAKQRPEGLRYTDDAGATLGWRWTPVDAAGLYVPGGLAAYPSSLLMNAMPAKVAGVKRIVMVVPAPDGVLAPVVLAAAKIAGVDEIYRIGGAQAVAALAHGTDTIRPVDKIVGPGNAFVASAKRQVFGTVGIDMVAGPSEVLVIADHTADAELTAADLLAQAEHDEAAQAILMTTDKGLADAVAAAVTAQLATLPRTKMASASWRDHGTIITVPDLAMAAALADRIAAEHLQLAVADPDALADKITHAGAIFLGHHTPEALGDYVAGPNHVLPTSRSARFSSGLGVLDFMKRTTLLGVGQSGLQALAEPAMALAALEGLDAHRLSIKKRLS